MVMIIIYTLQLFVVQDAGMVGRVLLLTDVTVLLDGLEATAKLV